MQRCIGVIYEGANPNLFGSLTDTRPGYMLPFGARYRIIDFTLSTMTNNDFSNVVLYGSRLIRSTLDHVGNGKPWELNRRRSGLTIFPPTYDKRLQNLTEIGSYFDTLEYYRNAKEEIVYCTDPMLIRKGDLGSAYDCFLENDYDILMLYKKQKDELGTFLYANKLILDEDKNIKNIGSHLGTEEEFNFLTSIGFMKKEVFIRIILEAAEKGNATTLIEAVKNNLGNLKIGAFEEEQQTEWIRDLKSYYRSNFDLLNRDIYEDLFYKNGLTLTKSKAMPPTVYNGNVDVSNSLLPNGCIIDGQVENSIIFRGVHVKKDAIVKNSIIFESTVVGEGSVVVNSITDKGVVIGDGVTLVGSATNPFVASKNEKIMK